LFLLLQLERERNERADRLRESLQAQESLTARLTETTKLTARCQRKLAELLGGSDTTVDETLAAAATIVGTRQEETAAADAAGIAFTQMQAGGGGTGAAVDTSRIGNAAVDVHAQVDAVAETLADSLNGARHDVAVDNVWEQNE